MGVTFFRPGAPLVIPGVHVMQTRAATVSSWWLSGGISAANCVAAYAAKGAASLAASYINLANPGTFNAAPGTAPTWDATGGWTFLAASLQYLTTGIVPATSWSAVVRFSDVANANPFFEAWHNSTQLFSIWPNNGAGSAFYGNGGTLSVSPSLTSGVLGLADRTGYRNGTADAGTIGAGTAPTRSIYIGAGNRGTPDRYISAKIQAIAFYNTTLSAGQMSALVTAMNNL